MEDKKVNKLTPFQVVRKDIDTEHFYYIDGVFVPTTTQIIDEAGPVEFGLRNFFINNTPEESAKISQDAKNFGLLVHGNIERLLYGLEINLEEENKTVPFGYKKNFKKHIMTFYNWFHDFKPDIDSIRAETVVGSKTFKYGGTVDLICEKDGEVWVIDFKTSSGIYFSHEVQLAAYSKAVEEYLGIKSDHTAILRTGSRHKSGYEFKEVSQPFAAFEEIYKTYLRLHGGEIPQPPEIEVYPETLQLFEKIK